MSFVELTELPESLLQLFDDRGSRAVRGAGGVSWTPNLDIVETEAAIVVAVDLAGVAADSLRLLVQADTVVIAGEKLAGAGAAPDGALFHLAEREFGRFARAFRLRAAVDTGRIKATLGRGVLQIVVPKIDERRGQERVVPIEIVR